MPRAPRIHATDVIYHIITRGNNKQEIFTCQQDYLKFISVLKSVKKKYPYRLYAYALMKNHFHLLLQVEEYPTSRIMQSILGRYTKYFNPKNKRIGHLFQERYKGIICEKDRYLAALIQYINLNPVRANVTKNPGEYEWSSHGEFIGKSNIGLIDSGLISQIFGEGNKGYNRYKQLLEDGMRKEYKEKFYPNSNNPFLGSDNFRSKLLKEVDVDTKNKSKNLDEIVEEVCCRNKVNKKAIIDKIRSKKVAKTRVEFIKKAVSEFGYSQIEIARYLRCNPGYISRILHAI